MKMIVGFFILCTVATTTSMPFNCSDTEAFTKVTDEFCGISDDSRLVGCLCDTYRTQIKEIFKVSLCRTLNMEFLQDLGNLNITKLIQRSSETIQSLAGTLFPRYIDTMCPDAAVFEKCLNENFTSSRELDKWFKIVVSSNFNTFIQDMCKYRNVITSVVPCIKDLVLPTTACVALTVFSASNSRGRYAKGANDIESAFRNIFCTNLGDILSCLYIQIDTVCNNDLTNYLRFMQTRYLSHACLRLSVQGDADLKDSTLVHCGIVTLSEVLLSASPAVISKNEIDIPSIVRSTKPIICRDIVSYIKCVNTNIRQSNNKFDDVLRKNVDMDMIAEQATDIQYALCTQGRGTQNGSTQDEGTQNGSTQDGGTQDGSTRGEGTQDGSTRGEGTQDGSTTYKSTQNINTEASPTSDSRNSEEISRGYLYDVRELWNFIYGLIATIAALVVALLAIGVSKVVLIKRRTRGSGTSLPVEMRVEPARYEDLDTSKIGVQQPNIYDKVQ